MSIKHVYSVHWIDVAAGDSSEEKASHVYKNPFPCFPPLLSPKEAINFILCITILSVSFHCNMLTIITKLKSSFVLLINYFKYKSTNLTCDQGNVVISVWAWQTIYLSKEKSVRTTYLNLDDVLRAGGLSSLKTLAKLRHFLVLPDHNIKQICVFSIYLMQYSSLLALNKVE